MPLPRQSNWRTHLAAMAIQAGLVALAATCALMLYQARLAARSEAAREAESLARVLQDGIETEVQVADLSLRNVDLDLRFIEQNSLAPELRTTVARQFEYSVHQRAAESPCMAASLRAAAVASLADMRRRIAQPAAMTLAGAGDMATAQLSMPGR